MRIQFTITRENGLAMIRYRDFGKDENFMLILREIVFLCACSLLEEHGEPTQENIDAILISPSRLKFRGVSSADGWTGHDFMGQFFVDGKEAGQFTAVHT